MGPLGLMQLNDWVQATLPKVLAEVSEAKLAQETLLATLAGIIHQGGNGVACDAEGLLSRYHTAVTALLLTSAPHHFSGDIAFASALFCPHVQLSAVTYRDTLSCI
jgi:hypothetical protein